MFDSPHPIWAADGAGTTAQRRHAAIAVALPGTGSDADFARRAFGPACAAHGIDLIAVEPDPAGVVAGYRAALDAAARSGPVLATGISLGAAVALEWAGAHPESAIGVVAALPAWTGPDTASCPAALSAAATAAQLRADGLDAVVARMRASSPGWLADALTQSWRSQWPRLPEALDEAAEYRWPSTERLGAIEVPVAIVTAVDDPVHPVAVAEEWARLIPRSELIRITLEQLGTDPAVLGHSGLGHSGLGHSGLGHSGLGHSGLGHSGLGHSGSAAFGTPA